MSSGFARGAGTPAVASGGFSKPRAIRGAPLKRHPEPSLDGVKYRAVDCLRIARPIDHYAARTVLCGDRPKALAQPFVESLVEALESVVSTGPRRCPRETDLGRQIEDHSQVRGETPQSEPM